MNFENFKKAIAHPAISVPLAGRFMSILRPAMLAAGIRDFPVIALTGLPGHGKTAIMRAVTGEKDIKLTFRHNVSDLTSLLERQTNRFIPIDDFAKVKNQRGRQRQIAVMDECVRDSYSGKIGQIIITIENAALNWIAESCRQRLLLIDVGQGIKEKECSVLTYYLAESDDLAELEDAFREYVESEVFIFPASIKAFLGKAQANFACTPRQASLIYVYLKTIWVLNDFLVSKDAGELDLTAANAIVEALCKTGSYSSPTLVERVLHQLLVSGDINTQTCQIGELCSHFCFHGCQYKEPGCENFCRLNLSAPATKVCYSPTELFLDYAGGFSGLLVEDTRLVPGFQRTHQPPPVLIINAEELVFRMNEHLVYYCQKNNTTAVYFSGTKLRKDLFDINRILVHPNEDKGLRYTFTQPAILESGTTKIRAVAIPLLPEEVDAIKRTYPKQTLRAQWRQGYSKEASLITKQLQQTWNNFLWKVTPIGEYSPETPI